ncbi:hypothetical protein ACOMHN_035835 [Nucella lapillus]
MIVTMQKKPLTTTTPKTITLHAAVLMTLLALTEARSLTTTPVPDTIKTTTTTRTAAAKANRPTERGRAGNSHLLFYLTVEKELVPQTKDLAAKALYLLQITCSEFYNRTSQCLLEADRLPEIPALGELPSESALTREGSKVFSKHLLKDVHRTLLKLQMLLEEENTGIEPLIQLIAYMDKTRKQLHQQMDVFYKVRLRDRDSFKNLTKSKKRYMLGSRLGDDCSHKGDGDDDDCLTEEDYRLRLLYTAYRQLLRVHHVLGYTVRLSWLALEEDNWL